MVDKGDSAFWKRLCEATPDMKRQDRSPWLQKLCGVGQSSVSRWKSGQNYPTIKNLIEISNATEYCIQYLLSGNGPKFVHSDIELPDSEQKLLRLWRTATPSARKNALLTLLEG